MLPFSKSRGLTLCSKGLNSLRHGLCTQLAVLPGEDAKSLAELSREFHNSIRPVGPKELYCVEKMILAYWRLRRIGAMEAEILQATGATREERLAVLTRYEAALQRTYARSQAEVGKLQATRTSSHQ
jgi:hypothetical protein